MSKEFKLGAVQLDPIPEQTIDSWKASQVGRRVVQVAGEGGGGSIDPEKLKDYATVKYVDLQDTTVTETLKQYVQDTLDGMGALAGKSVEVKSVKHDDTKKATIVTFAWVGSTGVAVEQEAEIPDGKDGKSIQSITSKKVGSETEITITLNDLSTEIFRVKDGSSIADITVDDTVPGKHKVTIKAEDTSVADKEFTVLDGTSIESIKSAKNANYGTDVTINTSDGKEAKFTIDKVAGWTSGVLITKSGVYRILNTVVGDFYFNSTTSEYYQRTDVDMSSGTAVARENYWELKGEIKGKEGKSAYETWLEIPGNAGKTKVEFIAAISGEGMNVVKVWHKPSIKDKDTRINTWYVYQAHDDNKAANLKLKDTSAYFSKITQDNLSSGDYYIVVPYGKGAKYLKFTLPVDITEKFLMTAQIQDAACNLDKTQVHFHNDTTMGYMFAVDAVASDTVPTKGTFIDANFTYLSRCIKENTAWLRLTNTFDSYTTAGKYALFNGVSYWQFEISKNMPTGWKSVYPGGLCALFSESQMRVWICGIDADGLICPLGKVWGGYVSVVPDVESDVTLTHLTLTDLGTWWQTCYAGTTGTDASDVTMQMGTSLTGVVTKEELLEIVGSEVLTTDKKTLKGAINELDTIVRRGGSTTLSTAADNLVGAVNELDSAVKANKADITTLQTKIGDISEGDIKGLEEKLDKMVKKEEVVKSTGLWETSETKVPSTAALENFITTVPKDAMKDVTDSHKQMLTANAIGVEIDKVQNLIPDFILEGSKLTIKLKA